MNVKELIEYLQTLPPEMPVILSNINEYDISWNDLCPPFIVQHFYRWINKEDEEVISPELPDPRHTWYHAKRVIEEFYALDL